MADLQPAVPEAKKELNQTSTPPQGSSPTTESTINPQELLASFDEILEEFATELKAIKEKGIGEDADSTYKNHQQFLKENWVFSLQNVYDLLLPSLQKLDFKGLMSSLVFVLKHLANTKFLYAKVVQPLLQIPQRVVPVLKQGPQLAKAYVLCKDPKIWIQRAKNEGVYLMGVVVAVLLITKAPSLIPDETYEDIEEELGVVEEVDMTDAKRMIDHLLTIPTILANLKPGESEFLLLQFDMVLECDSVITQVELQDPSIVSNIRSKVSDFLVTYRYEDLNSKLLKDQFRMDLMVFIQKIIPKGKILNIYFPKWVFSPMGLRRPGK